MKNNQPVFRTIDEKLEYWATLNKRGAVSASLISTSGLALTLVAVANCHVFLLVAQKSGSRKQSSVQSTRASDRNQKPPVVCVERTFTGQGSDYSLPTTGIGCRKILRFVLFNMYCGMIIAVCLTLSFSIAAP